MKMKRASSKIRWNDNVKVVVIVVGIIIAVAADALAVIFDYVLLNATLQKKQERRPKGDQHFVRCCRRRRRTNGLDQRVNRIHNLNKTNNLIQIIRA